MAVVEQMPDGGQEQPSILQVEKPKKLTGLKWFFGEDVSYLRLTLTVIAQALGLIISLTTVATYWSARTAVAFPITGALGVVFVIGGVWLMPAPIYRVHRRWVGLVKLLVGLSAATGLAVSVTIAYGARFSAGGNWVDVTERLTAIRWAALVVGSWVGLLGAQVWSEIGRPWVIAGEQIKGAENLNADLVIGRDKESGEEIVLKESDRYMHMLVQGPTGSGKTASMLSPGIVQDLRNPRVGLTVIEPKGDWINGDFGRQGVVHWAQQYGRKIFKVDPADPHTDVFNPLIGPRDMVAEVVSVSLKVLFNVEQNFFTTAQEALLKKTVYLLKWLKGDHLSFWDLHSAIRDFNLLIQMGKDLEARLLYWEEFGWPEGMTPDDVMEAKDLCKWFKNETWSKKGEKLEEVTMGLRNQLDNLMNNASFRRCIVPPPEPYRNEQGEIIGGRTIDLDEHLALGSVLCVSTNDGLLVDYSKVLGQMITTAFQYAASRRFTQPPERRGPHFIWMDEAGGYLTKSWGDFQTKARGFNVGIVLAFQALAQLEVVERGFSEMIVGQSRTRVIYGGLQSEDVQYWTKSFGTKEVIQESFGDSERYQPIHHHDIFSMLLGPMGYRMRTTSHNERMVEEGRIKYNDLWELPRGLALVQKVEEGSVVPPSFAKVDIVRRLPAPIESPDGLPIFDPEAGVAKLAGPLLPPVPNTILGGERLGRGRGGPGAAKSTSLAERLGGGRGPQRPPTPEPGDDVAGEPIPPPETPAPATEPTSDQEEGVLKPVVTLGDPLAVPPPPEPHGMGKRSLVGGRLSKPKAEEVEPKVELGAESEEKAESPAEPEVTEREVETQCDKAVALPEQATFEELGPPVERPKEAEGEKIRKPPAKPSAPPPPSVDDLRVQATIDDLMKQAGHPTVSAKAVGPEVPPAAEVAQAEEQPAPEPIQPPVQPEEAAAAPGEDVGVTEAGSEKVVAEPAVELAVADKEPEPSPEPTVPSKEPGPIIELSVNTNDREKPEIEPVVPTLEISLPADGQVKAKRTRPKFRHTPVD